MPQQLSFDLPAKSALGRDDFFVSPANALAVAMIDATISWSNRKLALSGPAGSGKTHLAHVWAAQTGAVIVAARDLGDDDVPRLASGPVVIEDVPQIARDTAAQNALFHLHNLVLAEGHALLLTGQGAPNLWGLSLPDLQSRVEAANHVALPAPDDALLAAVLAKLFDDRQITPKPNVIPYLVDHMDRSFEAAAAIVDRLDRMSLSESRTMSRPLAVRLIAELAASR
ncbi:MAG: chromosomal replication initiation ATPase DnaA [Paracoccaceae bacterium]